MTDIRRALESRSSRGMVRGAEDVWSSVTGSVEAVIDDASLRRPVFSFAAAFIAVLVVGVLVSLVVGREPPPAFTYPPGTTPSGAPCLTPPADALSTDGTAFEVAVSPQRVEAGGLATLRLRAFPGDSTEYITGIPSIWQCWDGSEWVDLYLLFKGPDGFEPSVRPLDAGSFAIGFGMPLTSKIRIPEVGPGTYRIVESAHANGSEQLGWTIVEVGGPALTPTTTIGEPPQTTPEGELCMQPPAEMMAESEGHMVLTVQPSPVAPGRTALLTLEPSDPSGQPRSTGLATTWQCWDGEKWADVYLLTKGIGGFGPGVLDVGSAVLLPRFGVPLQASILIPHVRSGIYRLTEGSGGDLSWTIVEVRAGFEPTTTTSAPENQTGCQLPPQSERELDSPFEMTRVGGFEVVSRGEHIRIQVSPPSDDSAAGYLIGLGASWQCWTGERWVQTHGLHWAFPGSGFETPYSVEGESPIPVRSLGIPLPANGLLEVPEVPAGLYRIAVHAVTTNQDDIGILGHLIVLVGSEP